MKKLRRMGEAIFRGIDAEMTYHWHQLLRDRLAFSHQPIYKPITPSEQV